MGITKQYLRWISGEKFGVIGTPCSSIQWIPKWINNQQQPINNRICATAACEDLIFWDQKTGEQVERFNNNNNNNNDERKNSSSIISCLTYNDKNQQICSGHHDGCIRLYNLNNRNDQNNSRITFSGHRGIVNCLAFDKYGLRLASGGKDNEIVIWDVVNQSGLFRLRGHKGSINQVEFMHHHSWILISASNDTFIKLWNLDTQHCFRTLIGHHTEILTFIVIRNDTEIISGGTDSELKVWKLTFSDDCRDDNEKEEFQKKSQELKEQRLKRLKLFSNNQPDDDQDQDQQQDDDCNILIENFGTILRKSMEKLLNLYVDQTERLLICHGKDNLIEIFKLNTIDEIENRMKKRIRKERKKHSKTIIDSNSDETSIVNDKITISDEIERLDLIVKCVSKIRSIDIRFIRNFNHDQDQDQSQEYRLAILLNNNQIEFQQLLLSNNQKLINKQLSLINLLGHRNDIRTIAISTDCQQILTASSDSIKLWNKSNWRCINTISGDDQQNIDYPLSIIFVPGNKYAISGSKIGTIQIINLISSTIQSTIQTSEENKPIWSINLLPDQTGIVSGCEDKSLKFWSFNLITTSDDDDLNIKQQQLELIHTRTLIVDEGIISVKISSNSKFIAAAMLDSCVKLYFLDSHKYFLSLYGHKLPVLCMDISSDCQLIVTGSSDKNIKIWGMNFGDCHRSIFAHDDNILSVQFVPKTHQFFSSSKDRTIKMWDADTFELITILYGHHYEIWTMCIAPNGKFLITSSHDRSIRTWLKTNEPLILDEEKELLNQQELLSKENDEQHTLIPGEAASILKQQESGRAQKKTTQTIRSIEKLIENIDIYRDEIDKLNRFEQQMKFYNDNIDKDKIKPPIRENININLTIYNTDCPYRFILETLRSIPSMELEETLLQLPFYYIEQLLKILSKLLSHRWEIELIARCICYLIRVNFGQITSSPDMIQVIEQIAQQMHQSIESIDDLAGINMAAINYYENLIENKQQASIFAELLMDNHLKKKRKQKSKKRSINTAPILTWH